MTNEGFLGDQAQLTMETCLRYVLAQDSVIPLGSDRSSFAKVNPNMSACANVGSLEMEVLQPNSRSDMVVICEIR